MQSAHLRGINAIVHIYEEATAMRPGEQILTAVYLDLLPRERGVDHGLLYVPPAYLPTYQASEYSLISPVYACLPTSLRPDLRGGTPGPISPRAQASNKRTWRYAARCAALRCNRNCNCNCNCNATPPRCLLPESCRITKQNPTLSQCASLKSHLQPQRLEPTR